MYSTQLSLNKLYDQFGHLSYIELGSGYWKKIEHDELGRIIYEIDSNGVWTRYEFTDNKRSFITGRLK